MVHTQSATPLDAVLVERNGVASDVWLRRDIREVEVETDGLPQTVWEAIEVHGVVQGHPSVESVTERFGELWEEFEGESLSDRELIVEQATMLSEAMADLSVLASDTAETAQLNNDAIAELSEMVAALMGGE